MEQLKKPGEGSREYIRGTKLPVHLTQRPELEECCKQREVCPC